MQHINLVVWWSENTVVKNLSTYKKENPNIIKIDDTRAIVDENVADEDGNISHVKNLAL